LSARRIAKKPLQLNDVTAEAIPKALELATA
jgi:hypothetical protein